MSRMCLAGLVALIGMTAVAQAGNIPVSKANGDFIAGTGIPGDNFTNDVGVDGTTVSLKARGRDTGQANSIDGTTYHLDPGVAGSNPASPWWVFDFQLTPGTGATLATDYRLVLEFDKDPTNLQDFVTITGNMFSGTDFFGTYWANSDGYFVNPTGGAWSNDTTPYVYSQAWRANFGFIDPFFNPNIGGTYDINLTVYDLQGNRLAGTSITAQVDVVPLPRSALMGLGLLGALGAIGFAKRRRKTAPLAA